MALGPTNKDMVFRSYQVGVLSLLLLHFFIVGDNSTFSDCAVSEAVSGSE